MGSVDHTFESRPLVEDADADGRSAALVRATSRLSARGIATTSTEGSEASAIPVLDVLSGLLPEGLRRGEAVSLAGSSAGASPGASAGSLTRSPSPIGTPTTASPAGSSVAGDRSPGYLALALLAGALRAGLWCAAVGVTGLGGLALADLLGRGPERRAGLARLLVAPEPGERWAQVTAALADGVDLLLVRPPEQVPAQLARRIDARLRQSRSGGTRHSAALLVLGAWPGARLELRTVRTVWTGLSGVGPTAGTGHLTGGQATLVAAGRATGGRTRTARLWLPTETGAAAPLIDASSTSTGAPSATASVTASATTDGMDDVASPGRRLSIVA